MAEKHSVEGEQRQAKRYFPTGNEYRDTDRKMREIKRQLDQDGGSPLDPKEVASLLQDIVDSPVRRLIANMFLPAEHQLVLVEKLNRWFKWGFTDNNFLDLGPPPPWPQGNKLAAVILDVSLESVSETFEKAWNRAMSVQRDGRRWAHLWFDSNHLRLFSGQHHQRGLRWQVVDLGANIDRAPQDVRDAKTSPSSAPLWMAYFSPRWIEAMNNDDVPSVWLPGYEVSVRGYVPWTHVPRLDWFNDSDTGRIELNADVAGRSCRAWAVPVLLEPSN